MDNSLEQIREEDFNKSLEQEIRDEEKEIREEEIREVDLDKSLEQRDEDREREGTVWTATAHIVTTVIGSGVLALAWSVAQLGWVVGPIVLFAFALVTGYTSTLLADCYRAPVTGSRNLTYMSAVRSYLGPKRVFMCGAVQYAVLWGNAVGYTITAASSIMAVKRSNCFHKNGHLAGCRASGTLVMIAFGTIEIILSQLPSLENVTWLSVVAATMSFAYSSIGLYLCIAKWASHGEIRGSLTGVKVGSEGISTTTKMLRIVQALGNIAFAYSFSEVLIEIQDTLKSPPPENVTMKKATLNGIGITTAFYLSLGCIGYAAFGDKVPGNILTGFGFYEPFWLIDIANICIVINFIGAYQIIVQPIFALFEKWIVAKWPYSKIHKAYTLRVPFKEGTRLRVTLSRLILRSICVTFTTFVSTLLPFFNAVCGLLGAMAFWPLTVFFPVSMYIVRAKVERGTPKWISLQSLSFVCLVVSLLASIGSVADIVNNLKHVTIFKDQN